MDPVKKRLAEEMLVQRLDEPQFEKCRALASTFSLDAEAVRRKLTELNLLVLKERTVNALQELSVALDAVADIGDVHCIVPVSGVPLKWGEYDTHIRDIIQVVLGRHVTLNKGSVVYDDDGNSGAKHATISVGGKIESFAVAHSEFLRKVLEIKTAELDALRGQLAKRMRKDDAV